MARYFLDSSALVKRYHAEPGTDAIEALLAQAGHRFFISRLALVEVLSSLARLVREGELLPDDVVTWTTRLQADVASGLLIVSAVNSRRLSEAATLIGQHGLTHHLRTLDAIHLATARSLHARAKLAAFVAADRKLLDVATQACGFDAIAIG